MKAIISSTKHHYVAIVGIFLIIPVVLALIAGMVGCVQPEPQPELELELQCTPMVAAGDEHTVGLRFDGTVVAAIRSAELAGWDLF
jgi:hypothetical protein